MKKPKLKQLLSNGHCYYECSECDKSLGQHYYNFCPHCGIRLREPKLRLVAVVQIKVEE